MQGESYEDELLGGGGHRHGALHGEGKSGSSTLTSAASLLL